MKWLQQIFYACSLCISNSVLTTSFLVVFYFPFHFTLFSRIIFHQDQGQSKRHQVIIITVAIIKGQLCNICRYVPFLKFASELWWPGRENLKPCSPSSLVIGMMMTECNYKMHSQGVWLSNRLPENCCCPDTIFYTAWYFSLEYQPIPISTNINMLQIIHTLMTYFLLS